MSNKVKYHIIILLLITSFYPVFAFSYHSTGSENHAGYVCRFLWNPKVSSINQVSGYSADMIGIAIQLGMDYTTPKNINKALMKLQSTGIKFPKADAFKVKIDGNYANGYNHRNVNHQGMNYEYTNANFNKRWLLGRDRVIVPVVGKVFGLREAEATLISNILVDQHLLGDIVGASELKTLLQLQDAATPTGVIDDLIAGINKYEIKRSNHKLKGHKIIPKDTMDNLKDAMLTLKEDCADLVIPNNEVDLVAYQEQSKKVLNKFTDDTSKILEDVGIKDGFAIEQTRKSIIDSRAFKGTTIGLGTGAVAFGLYTLADGVANGFDSINWGNAAVIGSATALSSTVSYAVLSSKRNMYKGWKGGAVAFTVDMAADLGFTMYKYFTGQISGSSAFAEVVTDTTSGLLSLGINTFAITKLGTYIGTMVSPGVGSAVGAGVGFLLSSGAYFIVAQGVDKVFDHFEIKDIIAGIIEDQNEGSHNVQKWIEDYVSNEKNQNEKNIYNKLVNA